MKLLPSSGGKASRPLFIPLALRAPPLFSRPPALDPKHFPQPDAFLPERWLAESGAAAGAATSSKRVAMPFGAGPRICPGRYLALAEIKMVAAMLLANFEIESVAAPGDEVQERFNVTMAPVGLQMKLRSLARAMPEAA